MTKEWQHEQFATRGQFVAEIAGHVMQYLRDEYLDLPDQIMNIASEVAKSQCRFYPYPSFAIIGLPRQEIASLVERVFAEVEGMLDAGDPESPALDE